MILKIVATAAPLLEVAGVFLLFRYGMPFRIPSPGGHPRVELVTSFDPDPQVIRDDQFHERMGFLGLGLIFVAAAIQAVSVWL